MDMLELIVNIERVVFPGYSATLRDFYNKLEKACIYTIANYSLQVRHSNRFCIIMEQCAFSVRQRHYLGKIKVYFR